MAVHRHKQNQVTTQTDEDLAFLDFIRDIKDTDLDLPIVKEKGWDHLQELLTENYQDEKNLFKLKEQTWGY